MSLSIVLLYRTGPLVCLKILVFVLGSSFHGFNVRGSHLLRIGDLESRTPSDRLDPFPFDQWDPREVGGPMP